MNKIITTTIFLLLALIVNGYALTPTATFTQTQAVTPSHTPTITPTIPDFAATYFAVTMRQIMLTKTVVKDTCGKTLIIYYDQLPPEYWKLYNNRNIVYWYLRNVKGLTNSEINQKLRTRNDFLNLYRWLYVKGVI
jgi:hypothetical protein